MTRRCILALSILEESIRYRFLAESPARLRWFVRAVIAVFSLLGGMLRAGNFSRAAEPARLHGVHEIVLTGSAGVANPFARVCRVRFQPPSTSSPAVTVNAFYDGGTTWRARLYVSEIGTWTWNSESPDDSSLDGRQGRFVAEPSKLRGKLRAHSLNSRQWMTANGRTFLNLSDTAYILFRSPNDPWQPIEDEVFQSYVRDAVRAGISSLRAGGAGGYAGWDRTSPVRGDRRYNRSNWCWEEPFDPTGANAYWERLDLDRLQTTDRRLQWLLENYPDVYVQLIMFGKEERDFAERWNSIPRDAREQTLAQLLARWSAWPQVFYQIVNDTKFEAPDNLDNREMVREIGRYIAQHEPFGTLVSAGAKRRVENPFVTPEDWSTWHTYLHIEKYSEVDASVCDLYYGERKVPVHLFYGEDWYEQDAAPTRRIPGPADADYYYRRMFWSVLLSGGSPNYGGRYPVLHPYFSTSQLKAEVAGRKYEGQLRGLDSIPYLRRFFEDRGIDPADLVPDDAVAMAVPEPQPEPNGPSRAQCARIGDDGFLIYLPCAAPGERSGGAEDSPEAASRLMATVDASLAPGVRVDLRSVAGPMNVTWLRAGTGETVEGDPVAGGGEAVLLSPWRGADVVLLLRQSEEKTMPPLIAHRGGASLNPENTLKAFRASLRAGLSVEMDVRRTADGQLAVIHDRTTKRTCNEDWSVAEKTMSELEMLDAAYWFDPAKDRTYPQRGQGVRIPSLENVLRLFVAEASPGAMLAVELKDGDERPVKENRAVYAEILVLISKYNLWDYARVEVSGVEEAVELRSRDPRVRLIFWSNKPDLVRAALRFPHFERIGMSERIAAEVGPEVKAAGKKLTVTTWVLTRASWKELSRLQPDLVGVDDFVTSLRVLQAARPPHPGSD